MTIGENPGASSLPGGRDPLVGAVINGKYRILRSIARGGMGRIYYATQAPLDRPVALKVVQVDRSALDEDAANFLRRFLLEASILAKLQHPNVVTLFDYGRIEHGVATSGEMYFIAMEYLAGETLSARLKKRNVLTAPEVLFLLRQIARGLREAHSHGVVHRDLKPSNIILVPESDGGELVKIVDFGIGKLVAAHDVNQDLTQDGVMVGTPRYMAPEQFEGTASTASDIYALGTIVYQALSGALPFQGSTLAEFLVAKFAHDIPSIRQVNPQAYLPEALESLVGRMLARAPEERATLDELFAQLAACERAVFGHAQSAPSVSGPYSAIPASRPSGPRLNEPSRVPPTIVGPLPHVPTGPTGSFAAQLTPRPMATSMRPMPTRGARAALVAAVVLAAVVMAAGVGAWAVKRSRDAAAAAPTPPATAPAASTTSPAAPAEDPSFMLTITSSPPGAVVMEGDRVVGPTPVSFPIERATVESTPRTFVVKKDGFLSARVVQGPTPDKQAAHTVTLAPDPQASSASGKPKGRSAPAARTNGGRANGDLDIRLNR